jgi:hypothetical protein
MGHAVRHSVEPSLERGTMRAVMKKPVGAILGACLASVAVAGIAQASSSTHASVQASANRSGISPVTIRARPNTTSEYLAYGPACNDLGCAQLLTVSESTSPIRATTAPAAALSPRLRRAVMASVPAHKGDLLRRVFVQHLKARSVAHTSSLPNIHLYTSASESTGLSILGIRFGVTEVEYANFWTHGSLVPSIVNQQRSWWEPQPTCVPGSGISAGAAASVNSCSWWYSPATGATGMMSARDYWTASALFEGFPISNNCQIFIHVTADGGISDTF